MAWLVPVALCAAGLAQRGGQAVDPFQQLHEGETMAFSLNSGDFIGQRDIENTLALAGISCGADEGITRYYYVAITSAVRAAKIAWREAVRHGIMLSFPDGSYR